MKEFVNLERKMYNDKVLLITGGTGSFGNAVLRRFLMLILKKSGYLAEMKKNKKI